MADITITPANVVAGSGASVSIGVAGETITAGQAVVRNAAGQYVLADADGATAALKNVTGIALNGAANKQPLSVLTGGPITIGGAVTAGDSYWLSGTPGGICPDADVGVGENAVLIGVATSATVLHVNITNSGASR